MPARPRAAVLAIAILTGAFVLRPLLARATDNPTGALVALFTVLLVVGWAWPVAREDERPPAPPWSAFVILALGLFAFAAGRVIGGGRAPAPITARVFALSSLAALAEELFFRRLLFAALRPAGAASAVVGSGVLFAIAHVTVYGWWVLPLDLGAGLLLAWQRSASGRWSVPALTHVVANVLVIV